MKATEIERYLNDNGFYPDSVYETRNNTMEITILDGDWSHEPGLCRHLMSKIGYERQDIDVIDSYGEDSFSAVHTYAKL